VTTSSGWVRAILPAAGLAAALFVGQLLLRDTPFYQSVFTPHAVQVVGALSKLAFLLLAAVYAWTSARGFEAGNPVRPAWRMLAAGLLAFFLAQLSYAPYQLFLNQDPPFPSVADVLFMLAYPLFVAALFAFIRGYEEAGYPVGTAASRWGLAAAVALASAALGYVILRPVVSAPGPGLATALNVAYPVLDFVLLIPTALLTRITLALRGGAAWRIWASLLGGFVFLCLGDILFAYLSNLGREGLDPLIHAMYILSYALLARGVLYQRELLRA
jgi:diguanylate cyclase